MFALLTLLLAGCAGEPSAPTRETASEVDPTSAGALRAESAWERSSFTVDGVQPCACLGEDVRFFGEVSFQYHEVTSGSGNFQFKWQAAPVTPNGPQFYVQGQTSGKLFQYRNGAPLNQSVHVGPGEVESFIDYEIYVAEDGTKLYVIFSVHTTVNAKGELIVERIDPFSVECER
jgi:hypothetical protein